MYLLIIMKLLKIKLQLINQFKAIQITALLCILVIGTYLLYTIIAYFKIKNSLQNPLIPEYLIHYVASYSLNKGIFLLIGLSILLFFKIAKQNLLIIITTILMLILISLVNHQIIGNWNSQIN